MKGFSGFGNSPAKQERPISKKNIKLQKGEMEGTWIYPGSDKGEKTKVPKVETEHELDVNEDLLEGVPELETGSMGAGGFGGK